MTLTVSEYRVPDRRAQLFEAVFANASVALFVMDAQQRCISMNPAAVSMTGYTLAEIQGRTLHEVIHHTRPDGRPYPLHECPIDRALPQNNREMGEEVFVHKDGHFYDVAYCASPIHEQGIIVGTVIEVQDISLRKRAKALATAERSLLDTIVEVAPFGVCVADATGRLIRMNPAMRRIWGEDAPMAASISEYRLYRGWAGSQEDGHPMELHQWPMSRVLAGEAVVGPVVVRIEPFDAPGTRRVIALSAASIQDGCGKIVAGVAMMYDITDLVTAQANVQESERRFRALAENIPQLVWIADVSGAITWCNRRWLDYTGTDLEQMKGRGWQAVQHPEHLERVAAKFRRHIEAAEPWEDTFPLRAANGEFRWFLSRAYPIRDPAGPVTLWFGTNTDVTDQLKTEESLRASNSELEQFAFVAAHDLQEPLRTISLYTDILLRKLASPDPQFAVYGQRIRAAAEKMRVLLVDLLAYSRVIHEPAQEVDAVCDLNAAVDHATSQLFDAIARSYAAISVVRLPVVRGDPSQLAIVFQNLLGNALKYRQEGVTPEVSISARREGDWWIISVRDNGIGFLPDQAENIFGLFKRLHRDRFPGTGLGLAICRRIIERIGGRIWAESSGEAGGGSNFFLKLRDGGAA